MDRYDVVIIGGGALAAAVRERSDMGRLAFDERDRIVRLSALLPERTLAEGFFR